MIGSGGGRWDKLLPWSRRWGLKTPLSWIAPWMTAFFYLFFIADFFWCLRRSGFVVGARENGLGARPNFLYAGKTLPLPLVPAPPEGGSVQRTLWAIARKPFAKNYYGKLASILPLFITICGVAPPSELCSKQKSSTSIVWWFHEIWHPASLPHSLEARQFFF